MGATSKWHAHVDYPPQCPHPTPKPNEQKSRRWGVRSSWVEALEDMVCNWFHIMRNKEQSEATWQYDNVTKWWSIEKWRLESWIGVLWFNIQPQGLSNPFITSFNLVWSQGYPIFSPNPLTTILRLRNALTMVPRLSNPFINPLSMTQRLSNSFIKPF